MKTSKDNRQLDDEFEPIAIGCVFEETKGMFNSERETELDPNSNSRIQD